MAHLNQGYHQAHRMYGAAVAHKAQTQAQQKEDLHIKEQTLAYTKAIKSKIKTLETPSEYIETFVISEILKIGQVYLLLKGEVEKWTRLKNRALANAKNKELGIYITCIKDCGMYTILSKLLSPTVGHTRNIQCAACKTLSIISHRPNRYRDARWYHEKQKQIALNTLEINGSIYNSLLLISHILNDQINDNTKYIKNKEIINLKCFALQLLANLVNHNSDVTIKTKQFEFISIILKILNNELLFELSLKCKKIKTKTKTKIKEGNTLQQIALLTLNNGINAILNLIQHNEINRKKFCQLNGWNFITKCLKHKCLQIRRLSLYFINIICSNNSQKNKLCSKYFLNSKFNDIESFKILLNMIDKICIKINKDIDKELNYQQFDNLLSSIIGTMSSLCSDNMLGSRKFCFYKSWKMIQKLFKILNKINKNTSYSISIHLYQQIFSLLSCFQVPKADQFDEFRISQKELIIKNNPNDNDALNGNTKLKLKQRKLKQKEDEKHAKLEFQKYQRIVREILRMLGGWIHTTSSPSPEPDDDNDDNNDNDDDDDIQDRDIILKFLFQCLAKPELVIGALCTIGKLCKFKNNGNIKRFDHMLENMKKEDNEEYLLCLKGLTDKLKRWMKCVFDRSSELNECAYFVNACNDLFDVITIDDKTSNNNNNKNKIIQNQHLRQDIILNGNIFYVLLMIITQPNKKYFTAPHSNDPSIRQQHQNNIASKEPQINNLKLIACYGLYKVIKNDIQFQTRFGAWIERINGALRDLATDPKDNATQQIALTHVIQSGCFIPNHSENIKRLNEFNLKHLLTQLFKEIQVTTTMRH